MAKKILLLDNFDSFTHILADYLLQLGANISILRNDVSLEAIQKENFDAIILSPGPGKPCDAGVMNEVIDYYHQKVPLLGICLGQQALGEYFDAKLSHAIKPMHGKISNISLSSDPVFAHIPSQINVVRYHSLILTYLPHCLEAIAVTHQQEIMAIRHRSLPIYGLQFHPEAALSEHGLKILQNWLHIYTMAS